ncbi:RISC-loading complex subunit tarbp2-like [Daphnia pulicaria]|uniref:RISC-loading complex subunit tarbp2-like n=1 Tax=Daphnia pulicaria TaxID=35523 RepID=UPI001EEB5680|nr:RISC-loading complex subunit tarbp2-like [Daphnia pulicaria]
MKIYNLDEDTLLDETEGSTHAEGMEGAAKTPVSLLQELYVKKGINPKYDLIQIEGAIHEPTFKYRVSVGELVAMGSGQSKKKAKHAAAKAVLDKIWGGHCSTLLENIGGGTLRTVTSPYDDGIPGNPVGNLQELCISHRWAPPSYVLEGENGLPHEREFVITCVVENHQEIGVGKSKKLAKRQAAYRMQMKLKDTPIELPNQGGLEDEDEIAQRASLRCGGLKENQSSKSSHGIKITQFHRSLRKLAGEKIAALQEVALKDPCLDYFQLLREISAEQKFDATYVDIEEKTHSGRYQCLLTMSLTPIAVVCGSGSSYEEAQKEAAFSALHYLKLMTKKMAPPPSAQVPASSSTDPATDSANEETNSSR